MVLLGVAIALSVWGDPTTLTYLERQRYGDQQLVDHA